MGAPRKQRKLSTTFFHPSQWTFKMYLLTAVLFVLVIVLSPKGLIEWALVNQEADRISHQKAELEVEVAALRREIDHFQKSPIAKERAIREELGYLREDEVSLEILAPEASPERPAAHGAR